MNQTIKDTPWDRPKWVRELRTFLDDTIVDFLPEDASEDEISERVREAAMAVVCGHYGHYVEQDQCNNPEHRYCLWCQEAFPNIPVGNYREQSETHKTECEHHWRFNGGNPCCSECGEYKYEFEQRVFTATVEDGRIIVDGPA